MVKKRIRENVPFECERLAKEEGHEVLLTPPYHSDLQPIELVWAMVKCAVGRQYNNETTLELVHLRLLAQFDRLQTSGYDSIAGMIKKCAETSLKFFPSWRRTTRLTAKTTSDEGDSQDDDSEVSDDNDLEEAPPEDMEEPWTEMEEF
ncbi:hypothetical protein IV203_025787 [Nitzschia inconspicua]|uniref:Tc1-like transposase DDE domain-containing protein n=1 Tax=Nitzschia inconspicua TaxID=303405 RepID=A0A9K3LJV7_9STRA|nr:hypothetical protein IV203_025787 [Nitzschia inconspicua]